MNNFLKGVGVIILGIALYFAISYAEIFDIEYFGTKRESAKREVFENNKSRISGMIQDLTRYRLEYILARDEIEKKAIAETIRMQFANFNGEHINNTTLKRFYYNIMNGGM